MNATKYITSELDNSNYCISNGQFLRHLKLHGYTYQQYYEEFITGIKEVCAYCKKPKRFYQSTHTYASTCGAPECRGVTIRNTKNNWSDEQKQKDSINKRKANKRRTVEEKQAIREKVKATNLKKFGNENSFIAVEQKEKIKQTKLIKYGNEFWNNAKKASESRINRSADQKLQSKLKRYKTNLERYGVENPLLAQDFTSKSNKQNSRIKSYTMPSGKIVGVMGYEHLVLDILLKTFNEDDIELHDNLSHTCFEKIKYIAVNRHHLNYYPDIYIKPTNTIIEVKSQWWWDGNGSPKYKSRLENNLRKRNATIALGYNYEVWVFKNRYEYRIIKSEQDF